MNARRFWQEGPAGLIVLPVLFAALTLGILALAARSILDPYVQMASWVFAQAEETTPSDLFAQANAALVNASTTPEPEEPEDDGREHIPLSSITYPAVGDRYGRITISGTSMDTPLYYGDYNAQLRLGAGTYQGDTRVGIPGEGKTILLAAHRNSFFNELKHVEVGAIVTIETHYGTYTYTVERMAVYPATSTESYDFTRTDENLILYTCYPIDGTNFGLSTDRYFVYASFTSGPALDAGQ